jgi:hypothetical protein
MTRQHGSVKTPPKPKALPFAPEIVPEALRRLRRWVCWSWVWKKDKYDKPPLNPRTLRNARSNDPRTWGTFDETLAAFRQGKCDGIGIMLGDLGDGRTLAGVDLDDVRDPGDGTLQPWAAWTVTRLDTYAEVSPSGTGVKMLCWGKLPPGRRDEGERGVEMYDRGRYFTVTSCRLDGTPADVMDRADRLAELHAELLGEPKQGGGGQTDRERALSALAGLNTTRAVGYRDWLGVGMALHAVDPSQDMLDAWDRWSQACPKKYKAGTCAEKWATFKGQGLTLGSLLYWARQDGWQQPPPSANGKPPPSANGVPPPSANGHADEVIPCGATVRLKLRSGHRTTAKVTATVDVLHGDEHRGVLTFTSTPTSKEAAVRDLIARPHVDRQIARDALDRVLSAAARRADREGGPALADVVDAMAWGGLDLRFRTEKGAWSEALHREVSLWEYLRDTPAALVEAAARAARGLTESQLHASVTRALQMSWATRYPALPEEENATSCGPNSDPAKRWRYLLVRLLTVGVGMEKMASSSLIERISLVTRMCQWIEAHADSGFEGWVRVHPAFACWYRLDQHDATTPVPPVAFRVKVKDDDHETTLVPSVGIHAMLVEQVRYDCRNVSLPGVKGQESLAKIGKRYGCFDPNPKVPTEMDDGNTLCVLSADVLAEALGKPVDRRKVYAT